MGYLNGVIYSSLMVLLSKIELVSANWDPATGHLHDYRPSQSWLSQHKSGARCYNDIQVAECAQNTRLSYPNVQLFATFQVNHADDNYHGCQGTDRRKLFSLTVPVARTQCCRRHLIWKLTLRTIIRSFGSKWFLIQKVYYRRCCHAQHSPILAFSGLGGISGPGTNPIADPQTGAFGYETSDGKFHQGKPNTAQEQRDHDANYPGFKLPPAWSGVSYPSDSPQPVQPKCGTPDGANLDPGQVQGAYGNYKPAPASSYKAPPIHLS
ncbi:hypothetical protein VP01_235g3 [Puccinia sorghi]|uniref:Uncharacterized protein n=1 Tax=Puccinia sorghi TaxID=27349 RepID=A0A0L6V754_9BASI|nr:hypothetical protein VP01_235g3 [Puccinia sorghi]